MEEHTHKPYATITPGDKIAHSHWGEFQTRFPPKLALTHFLVLQSRLRGRLLTFYEVCPQNGIAVVNGLRGTYNGNGGLGKYFVRKVVQRRRITRRIQCALPAVDKPSFENRLRGCVLS